MERLPAILDVRDDLHAARDAADRDVDDDVDDALARLDAYADRDAGDREGLLDDVDNELLRLETQLSNEKATRRLRAARNRIHVFRESLSGSGGDGLVVVETKLTASDDERERELADLHSERAAVSATVVNDGPARNAVVEVRFYDDRSEQVGSSGTETFAFDGGAQKTVSVPASVPEDAAYYVTVARSVEG